MIFKALNNLVSILSSVFTERIKSGYAIRDCKKLASHQHQEQTIWKWALTIKMQLFGIACPVILDEKDHLIDLNNC